MESAFLLAAVDGDQDAPAAQQTQSKEDPLADLTQQQRRQLQIYSVTLFNESPEIQPELRRDAARELIEMRLPASFEAVSKALQSGRPRAMAASIDAMQSLLQPPPELMDAAIAASTNAPAESLDSLSWVIARYGSGANARIIALASDNTAPLAMRLGPIHVLASFCTRESAAKLIELMNDVAGGMATPGTEALLKSITASLERLTGLPYGGDLSQWRRWWTTAESLPSNAWTQFVVDSLGERIADLQRQLQQQRIVGDRTSRRLFDAYRELYPALAVDEQIRRLPGLLDDELAAVREFGLSRAALLVRDSIRLSPETLAKLAQKLADPEPQLRLAALQLLEELNDEKLSALIVDRLAVERTPEVLSAVMEAALKRPNAAYVEPTIKLLGDVEHGTKAARLIWRSFDPAQITPEQLDRLREAARLAISSKSQPEFYRVHALVCNDHELQPMIELLDSGDAHMRAAVADAFARRGLKQPLIDRAEDEVIYPYAVRALSGPPADLAAFRALASLQPAEASAKLWRDAIVGLAGQLPLNDLLAADDVLANTGSADVSLRVEVLARVAGIAADAAPEELHMSLAIRLVPLWLELGLASKAHEFLQQAGPWPVSGPAAATIADLRFKAAVLCGDFDAAEKLRPNPMQWLALLESLQATNTGAAVVVRAEILRRFDATLTAQQRAGLLANVDSASAAERKSATQPPGL